MTAAQPVCLTDKLQTCLLYPPKLPTLSGRAVYVLDKVTIDVLTYAGCEASLRAVESEANHRPLKANICDRAALDT